MYADIIIDITHEKLDKVFQYRVPEELEGDLRTGAGVIVPFGRGNRETKGYIVGFSETCDYDAEKIKDILRTDTSSVAIEARLVALAAWMKEYYGGTMHLLQGGAARGRGACLREPEGEQEAAPPDRV